MSENERINYATAKYLYDLLDPWVNEIYAEFGDEWGSLIRLLQDAAHAYLAVDDTRSFVLSQWVLEEIGEGADNDWWGAASDEFYHRLRRVRLRDRPSMASGISLTGDDRVAFDGFVEAFKIEPEWMQPTEEDRQANTLLDHPEYETWLQVQREYARLAPVFEKESPA